MTFSLFSKNSFDKSQALKDKSLFDCLQKTPTHKCRECKISGSQMTFLLFSKNTFNYSQASKDKSLLYQQLKAFKRLLPTRAVQAKSQNLKSLFYFSQKNTFDKSCVKILCQKIGTSVEKVPCMHNLRISNHFFTFLKKHF
jgi:hypothetical protein